MKYYLIRSSSDPKVIGVKNGLAQVEFGEKENKHNLTYKKTLDFFSYAEYWRNDEVFPEFEVHLNASILKNAKLTSFIEYTPFLLSCPFLVHNDVVSIFSRFNIQRHRNYPVKIYDSKECINSEYKLFCCPYLGFDVINYSESIFYTGSDLLGKTYYTFNNEKEYRSFPNIINSEVLKMNDNFDSSLDLFVGRIGGMHVSERLKNELQNNNVTGIKILDNIGPKIITN